MREIKFRGKNKDGKWIYGYYFRYEDKHCIVPGEYSSKPSEYFEVDPITIGQCISFPDKNGKEIYEGDIIGIDNIEQKYYVKWKNGAFYLFHTEFKDWNNQPLKWGLLSRAFEADMIKFGKISVIGNIHESK